VRAVPLMAAAAAAVQGNRPWEVLLPRVPLLRAVDSTAERLRRTRRVAIPTSTEAVGAAPVRVVPRTGAVGRWRAAEEEAREARARTPRQPETPRDWVAAVAVAVAGVPVQRVRRQRPLVATPSSLRQVGAEAEAPVLRVVRPTRAQTAAAATPAGEAREAGVEARSPATRTVPGRTAVLADSSAAAEAGAVRERERARAATVVLASAAPATSSPGDRLRKQPRRKEWHGA
jgi:hypothetical protein